VYSCGVVGEYMVGKALRAALRALGRHATSLPGKVALRLSPGLISKSLSGLPEGVVFVTGTNGKTTTTSVLTALLRAQGLRVLTNASGSNMRQGIATEILNRSTLGGRLDADIAVLEVDEAVAATLAPEVHPRLAIVLNVHRDQLDRYGEVDTTAGLLAKVAAATTGPVIFDIDERSVAGIAAGLPSEQAVFFRSRTIPAAPPDADEISDAPTGGPVPQAAPVVQLLSHRDEQAVFRLGEQQVTVPLHLQASYQVADATAAVAALYELLGDRVDTEGMSRALAQVHPAFGRGEAFSVSGGTIYVVLVKNPHSFNTVLRQRDYDVTQVMLAMNSEYADGRDISWIWDVHMDAFRPAGVSVSSGGRSYDVALRLYYDDIPLGRVVPDLEAGVRAFAHGLSADHPGIIFCNYTSMLAIRPVLQRLAAVQGGPDEH
jgi:UDP-N-acetylmuramyl tripeptide synthase